MAQKGFVLSLTLLLLCTFWSGAHASMVEPKGQLGGWTITGSDLQNVGIVQDGEIWQDEDDKWAAKVEIFKTFDDRLDPGGNVLPSIVLSFELDPDAEGPVVTRFYIADEWVRNRTDYPWIAYSWGLINTAGPVASFNKELTNPTTDSEEDGWLILPFTEFAWEDGVLNSESLDVWNGWIPAGGDYLPGVGTGSLVIDVDLSGAYGDPQFFFKQYPTTPEPTSIGLLMLAGVFLPRFRRRS